MSHKFTPGQTYTTGEGRKYVWRFEVVRRTSQFVTIADVSHDRRGGEIRKGISVDNDGNEYVLPLGRYSMAPTLNAEDIVLDDRPDMIAQFLGELEQFLAAQ